MQKHKRAQAAGINALHSREIKDNDLPAQFAKHGLAQRGKGTAYDDPAVAMKYRSLPGSFYSYVQHSELLYSSISLHTQICR
jgi:hypothetical protein